MSWVLDHPDSPVAEDLSRFGIGPRLAAIAELIPRGCAVADIGTDHALLPIALKGSGRSHALGIDASEQALASGRANRSRFGVHVELRRGEGLELDPGEAAVVVIAGVGGRTIASILASKDLFELGIEQVVAQPNTDFEIVRTALAGHGLSAFEERLAVDGGRLFVVISGKRGSPRTLTAAERWVGALRSDPLFPHFARIQREHLARSRDPEAALVREILSPSEEA